MLLYIIVSQWNSSVIYEIVKSILYHAKTDAQQEIKYALVLYYKFLWIKLRTTVMKSYEQLIYLPPTDICQQVRICSYLQFTALKCRL